MLSSSDSISDTSLLSSTSVQNTFISTSPSREANEMVLSLINFEMEQPELTALRKAIRFENSNSVRLALETKQEEDLYKTYIQHPASEVNALFLVTDLICEGISNLSEDKIADRKRKIDLIFTDIPIKKAFIQSFGGNSKYKTTNILLQTLVAAEFSSLIPYLLEKFISENISINLFADEKYYPQLLRQLINEEQFNICKLLLSYANKCGYDVAKILATNNLGADLFSKAITFKDLPAAKLLHDEYKVNINLKMMDGCSYLHLPFGRSRFIPFLIARDLKVINGDNNGNTPLHQSARLQDLAATKLFVAFSPEAHFSLNSKGEIPLFSAIGTESQNYTFKFLLNFYLHSGKKTMPTDAKGSTLLHKACLLNNFFAVQLIIGSFVPCILIPDNNGDSCLLLMMKRFSGFSANEVLNAEKKLEFELLIEITTFLIIALAKERVLHTSLVLNGDKTKPDLKKSQNYYRNAVNDLLRQKPTNLDFTLSEVKLLMEAFNDLEKAEKRFEKSLREKCKAENSPVLLFEPNLQPKVIFSPVHAYCKHDEIMGLKKLIAEFKEDVDLVQTTSQGCTALHLICERFNADPKIADFLLEKIPLDKKTKFLMATYALFDEPAKRFKLLKTAAYIACRNNHVGLVTVLLNHGDKTLLNLDVLDKNLLSAPFFAAIDAGAVNVLKFLIEKGYNFKKESEEGYTSLYRACESGNEDVVRIILQALTRLGLHREFINANNKLLANRKPLQVVIEKDCVGILKLLHENDLQFSLGRGNRTPFQLACLKGASKVVQYLIDQGLTEEENFNGNSVLHLACMEEHVPNVPKNSILDSEKTIRNLVIFKKSLLDTKNSYELTPFLSAAVCGGVLNTKTLIALGANVKEVEQSGSPAIFLATENNHALYVETFFDVTTPMLTNHLGAGIFHVACQNGADNVIKFLLRSKMNLFSRDKEGKTPLDYLTTSLSNSEFINRSLSEFYRSIILILNALLEIHLLSLVSVKTANLDEMDKELFNLERTVINKFLQQIDPQLFVMPVIFLDKEGEQKEEKLNEKRGDVILKKLIDAAKTNEATIQQIYLLRTVAPSILKNKVEEVKPKPKTLITPAEEHKRNVVGLQNREAISKLKKEVDKHSEFLTDLFSKHSLNKTSERLLTNLKVIIEKYRAQKTLIDELQEDKKDPNDSSKKLFPDSHYYDLHQKISSWVQILKALNKKRESILGELPRIREKKSKLKSPKPPSLGASSSQLVIQEEAQRDQRNIQNEPGEIPQTITLSNREEIQRVSAELPEAKDLVSQAENQRAVTELLKAVSIAHDPQFQRQNSQQSDVSIATKEVNDKQEATLAPNHNVEGLHKDTVHSSPVVDQASASELANVSSLAVQEEVKRTHAEVTVPTSISPPLHEAKEIAVTNSLVHLDVNRDVYSDENISVNLKFRFFNSSPNLMPPLTHVNLSSSDNFEMRSLPLRHKNYHEMLIFNLLKNFYSTPLKINFNSFLITTSHRTEEEVKKLLDYLLQIKKSYALGQHTFGNSFYVLAEVKPVEESHGKTVGANSRAMIQERDKHIQQALDCLMEQHHFFNATEEKGRVIDFEMRQNFCHIKLCQFAENMRKANVIHLSFNPEIDNRNLFNQMEGLLRSTKIIDPININELVKMCSRYFHLATTPHLCDELFTVDGDMFLRKINGVISGIQITEQSSRGIECSR